MIGNDYDDGRLSDASSQETIRPNGRFQPGVSGNPGGRSPTRLADGRTLRDIARDHTDTAIDVLVQTMGDEKSGSAARVSAAVALLDRGWGKPAQFVELSGVTPYREPMSDVDRAAKLAALVAVAQERAAAEKRAAEEKDRDRVRGYLPAPYIEQIAED